MDLWRTEKTRLLFSHRLTPMDTDIMEQTIIKPFEHDDLTERIIGCGYAVSNSLGSGFLEKVYENAFVYELRQSGFEVIQQKPIQIYYRNILVGEYFADLLVNGKILIELKGVPALEDAFFAQCLNYLRATGLETCLLINFGKPELQIKRISARPEWVKK